MKKIFFFPEKKCFFFKYFLYRKWVWWKCNDFLCAKIVEYILSLMNVINFLIRFVYENFGLMSLIFELYWLVNVTLAESCHEKWLKDYGRRKKKEEILKKISYLKSFKKDDVIDFVWAEISSLLLFKASPAIS